MKTKEIFTGIFVLSLLAGLAYLWFSPAGVKPAPEYTFKIVDGRKISLVSLQGRPVIISFWATSCPGCIKEMPHLIELYHDYAKHGLEIIGVAMANDPPSHVMEMRKRKNIPYPISLDVDGSAAKSFGDVSLTPTSILISPEGKIVMQKIGEMDMTLVRQKIKSMLGVES